MAALPMMEMSFYMELKQFIGTLLWMQRWCPSLCSYLLFRLFPKMWIESRDMKQLLRYYHTYSLVVEFVKSSTFKTGTFCLFRWQSVYWMSVTGICFRKLDYLGWLACVILVFVCLFFGCFVVLFCLLRVRGQCPMFWFMLILILCCCIWVPLPFKASGIPLADV